MNNSQSPTKLNQQSFCGTMGDVLAKEAEKVSASQDDNSTWGNREDADGASSVEDSIIRDIQEQLKLSSIDDEKYDSDDSSTQCNCDACQEPIISISNPHFDRVQEHWLKLRKFISIVYKYGAEGEPLDPEYQKNIQTIINELVTLEPHLLYKQLEAQIQEWVIETELKELENCLEDDDVEDVPHLFISGLLESYRNLMAGADLAFPLLEELQKVHLSKFNMTWNLLNEHIYQSCIYADPLVQNNVPIFIGRLSSTCESMESNKDLVKNFLYLDDKINSAANAWLHCKERLAQYKLEDQASIEGKRTLLEFEWKDFTEGRKTSQMTESLKQMIATSEKCIHKNGSCKRCKNSVPKIPLQNVGITPCICTGSLHECGEFPQCKPYKPSNSQTANNKYYYVETKKKKKVLSVDINEITSTIDAPPPLPPQTNLPQATKAPPPSHPHSHGQVHPQRPPSNKTATAQQAKSKPQDVVSNKCVKPRNCHKIKHVQSCSHHTHAHGHKHSHGEPIKRISSCSADHRVPEDDESDSTLPLDDSCSDKSSTSTQKGSGTSDPRHCDCCYCEVFGHGVPSGAPVSRNYQEIRERLRLALKKKNSLNNKKEGVAASTTNSGSGQGNAPNQLLNKLPPPKSQKVVKGDECIDDILNFIEGKTKGGDSKKAAKKARQKEKKLQEMYQKKLEEEAIEREKLEAEKRRKEELLKEKERLIKEQKRLEKELQKQNQKLNNNRKALSVKNTSNENNISNNNSKKGKKNKQQQNQQQQQQQQSQQNGQSQNESNKNKQKKKNKKQGEDIEMATSQAATNSPKMVTIKRVLEPTSGGSEPTVTITLRGNTPNEDKVLYTLQNGHVCPMEEKKKANDANNSGKLSKKQLKKLQQQQQQESQQRATTATHVQHTPGVVEINVNGSTNGNKVVNIKQMAAAKPQAVAQNGNFKKGKVSVDTSAPAGFSSTSVINVKQTSSAPVKKPVAPSAPPQLTTSTAIQISNAISSLTAKQDFNLEDLRLPPGITITKVEAPLNSVEERSVSSASCDGGDSDYLNKENSTLDNNAQGEPAKKSKKKKKKNKQNQQEESEPTTNGFVPNGIQGQGDGSTIFKVKGSMVTIRNAAAFPNDESSQFASKNPQKKGRNKDCRPDEWSLGDEESVFAPKDIDLENGDIDDAERELEAFKRFCSQSVPPKQKEKVHLNIKDIVLKKKRAEISCS